MKRMFVLLIPLFVLTGFYQVKGETNPELGYWNVLLLKTKINNKFSFLGETNFRSEKVISTFTYCEYRGSIIYSLTKQVGFSFGAGGFKKSTEDVFFTNANSQTEFRTWVDFLLLKHSCGRLNFEHRSRLEQRFIPSDYQNRLRYRLLLNLPLNHRKMTDKTVFLSSYNEFFIGENDPSWEKNKFCGGAGYKFNENMTFQVGNVINTDIKKDYTTGKNYLMLMILYNFTGKNHHS